MRATDTFDVRFDTMGDIAEEKFIEWADDRNIVCERWGFNRPAFKRFYELPIVVRFQPDFLCEMPYRTDSGVSHFFVEVKGVGRDGIIKVKDNGLRAAFRTSSEFTGIPFMYYFYDSYHGQYTTTTLHDLITLSGSLEKKTFPEGNVYYPFPVDRFEWRPCE